MRATWMLGAMMSAVLVAAMAAAAGGVTVRSLCASPGGVGAPEPFTCTPEVSEGDCVPGAELGLRSQWGGASLEQVRVTGAAGAGVYNPAFAFAGTCAAL